MQTIDHDPQEPKIDRTPGPWRWVFPVIGAVVAINAFTHGLDWISFGGGALLSMVFTAWAIEITGNKVPTSWKTKTNRDHS